MSASTLRTVRSLLCEDLEFMIYPKDPTFESSINFDRSARLVIARLLGIGWKDVYPFQDHPSDDYFLYRDVDGWRAFVHVYSHPTLKGWTVLERVSDEHS